MAQASLLRTKVAAGLIIFHIIVGLGHSAAWPIKQISCDACIAAGAAAKPFGRRIPKDVVVAAAVPICEHINATGECSKDTVLGAWPCKDLCEGMMDVEADVLLDLLDTHGPRGMCGGVGACPHPNPAGLPEPSAPVVTSNLSDFSGEKVWKSWAKPTGTFVHFSDLHMQMKFAEGTVGKTCGQPVCCRPEQPANPGVPGAGPYGDDDCDMSPRVFEAMIEAFKRLDPRPDFIINTGDDPAHIVWHQTHDSQVLHITNISQMLLDAGFGDIPVIQGLGNHEANPVDQYRVPLSLDKWLYGSLSGTCGWGSWLDDDAKRTIDINGFYAQRLMPGLWAVVMHSTMFEEGNNWFFNADGRDTQGQMLWLTNALDQARARGEKVFMLRHHPLETMSHSFSQTLRSILEKYNDIIIASFVGHSHTSWFTAIRDKETGNHSLNVEYCAGGSGPDAGTLNPTFRVYKYDTTTYELLDFDQYALDYRAANANPTSSGFFNHTYSAKSEFGLMDLSATSWSSLAMSWLGDSAEAESTWERYASAMTRNRSPASRQNRKGEACRALMSKTIPRPECETGDVCKLHMQLKREALGQILVNALEEATPSWQSTYV